MKTKKRTYLLKLAGCVEPDLIPVKGNVHAAIISLINDAGLEEEDALIRLDISARGIPTVSTFSGGEMDELRDQAWAEGQG